MYKFELSCSNTEKIIFLKKLGYKIKRVKLDPTPPWTFEKTKIWGVFKDGCPFMRDHEFQEWSWVTKVFNSEVDKKIKNFILN